jgi:hypothetical protein
MLHPGAGRPHTHMSGFEPLVAIMPEGSGEPVDSR